MNYTDFRRWVWKHYRKKLQMLTDEEFERYYEEFSKEIMERLKTYAQSKARL